MKTNTIKNKEAKAKILSKSSFTRHKEFMLFFRHFDSVHECVDWICVAIGVKPITVMVWREKKGTVIPQVKWDLIKKLNKDIMR
jgi:hypothetical protein